MTNTSELIENIKRQLSSAEAVGDLCLIFRDVLKQTLRPDVITLHCSAPIEQIPLQLHGASSLQVGFDDNQATVHGELLAQSLFLNSNEQTQVHLNRQILKPSGYKSLALIPIHIDQERIAVAEVAFIANYFDWKFDSRLLLEKVVAAWSNSLNKLLREQYNSEVEENLSENFTSLGELISQAPNLVTVETNEHFTVTTIAGNTEKMLGISPEEILGDSNFWSKILHPSDAKKLLLKTQRGEPKDLEDEFRIIHQKTAQVHALLVSARARIGEDGKLEGWTGFALDVTDRYEAKQDLLLERSRLEALYKVSRALQSSPNSSVVALRSLQVLINATQADSAFIVMSARGTNQAEILASVGFGFKQLESFEHSQEFTKIIDWQMFDDRVRVLDGQESLHNFRSLLDSQISQWRIAQIALKFEDQELGALFICTKKPKFFSSSDLDLLDIVASQIALSTRQAELFITEKEQASSLAALYRLSHELSQQLTAQEVIEHAVPIIKEELACKRIWLGVMNEQQTLLIGQSGIGPGMRDGVSDVSIDLSVPHPFLDTAIRTRQSVIVPLGAYSVCPDLRRMFDRLEVSPFSLVPLVALGQVVGVLAVEPLAANTFFGERKRQLLDSMASEIATIILARRFESRVADSAKMRMAALLSSGVAHNFNNLLQAIMGQASLIELETLTQEQRSKIAGMILDAASKGANLVKQLYSFSSESTFSPDVLSLRTLVVELRDRFKAQLGTNIKLEYKIVDDSLEIKGDPAMIRQVFSNLIENAKEALQGVEEPIVKISANRIRVRSGEIHSDLAPGSYVSISVEDNGQGMSEEAITRCFEPFYSTKNVDPRTGLSFSGAGLGLSAAYLIVRQHEGAIIANSQKGQGTSFTVYFPVVILKSNGIDKPELKVVEREGASKKSQAN